VRRRILAALAALVLLVAGTVVLLAYVKAADARALADVRTTEVLVADQVIPEGTPATELTALVRTQLIPRKAAVDGRVTDLDELSGLVATVELQPGEQLLQSRFGEAEAADEEGTVPVPPGLQEVTVLLEPQRAVGGRLEAGDTVGVVLSIGEGKETGETAGVIHRVLITQIQGAPLPADEAAEGTGGDAGTETASSGGAVPVQSLMITLAVTAPQAEAVVYGMEHGSLWLSLENEDAGTGSTGPLDAGNIYVKDFS
jgi:pilus assembly protein CpaB